MNRKIGSWLVAAMGAAGCLLLIVVMATQGLSRAGVWAAPLAALAGIVAAVATVWALRPQQPQAVLPPKMEVPDWVVERPAELSKVVAALVGGRARTVGIATGVHGGGVGKTTLARMVCGDRRVRRRFGRRVYLVTVGRDVRGPAAVAAKVNDVIKLMTGSDAPFPDPQPAGQQLGALLDAGPPRLLVLDDVWERDDEMDELHASLIAELASGRMALPVTMEMTVLGAATSAWATTP